MVAVGSLHNAKTDGMKSSQIRSTLNPMPNIHDDLDPYYTIAIFAPTMPVDTHAAMYPVAEGAGDGLAEFARHCTASVKIIAEIQAIIHGLKKVASMWKDFDSYFGELLSNEFLDHREYTKLLFDDDHFTRSRLYFWALATLTEFMLEISENVKQWELYKEARVAPRLGEGHEAVRTSIRIP